MRIPIYQVDAFTDHPFGGNPAAVCPLETWLDDATLQAIAAENNLSETAFFVREADGFRLRWFTPALEVDLCGHATLASAWVLFNCLDWPEREIHFITCSGRLTVRQEGKLLCMDFPARSPQPERSSAQLESALGVVPKEVWGSRDLLILLEDETQVQQLQPDMRGLMDLPDYFGVIVTAPGKQADFVSRFFAPKEGIDEDPVTGSAHCTLIPFWAQRLGKDSLNARQLSARGGKLACKNLGARVEIAGEAHLFSHGHIFLDEALR